MNKNLYLALVSGISIAVLMSITDPQELPALALLVPFALIGTFIYSIIMMAGSFLFSVSAKREAAVVSLVAVCFLGLSSTGQTSGRDMALLVTLGIVGLFYAVASRKQ